MTFRLLIPVAALPLLLGSAPVAAQAPGRITGELAVRIDSVFHRFSAPGSPGCALGVMRGGELVYAKGYGLASVELRVPITPATVFDLGSVSKQFTALAVVLLAQDGKLTLDDEIQMYVPEIPRYAKPVRIRHLLHHTSGLRDYIDLLSWSGAQDESVTGDRDALDLLARQKDPNFAAGAEHLYSNSGYFLLSVIVQRVSGKTLRAFAAERIFGPLGMRRTFFLNQHAELVPDKAASYAPARTPTGFRLALANWEQTGDGAVQTTVEDLLLWERNFSSGVVGGAAGLRALVTPGTLSDGKPISYALGLVAEEYRGQRRIGHGGGWAGFRTQLTRFPDQGTAIATLCNVSNANPARLTLQVADLVLADVLTGSAAPPSPPGGLRITPRGPRALTDYVGRYRSEELATDWVIFPRNDSLRVRIGALVEEPVGFTADGAVAAGTRARFIEENGRITGIALTSRGARDFRLTRIVP